MVKTLLCGCALASTVFYLGASFVDDTVQAAQKRQEVRQARANQF